MQSNVIDYFEEGALIHCRDKVAVQHCGLKYTFGEIERFAKNCAQLILDHSPTIGCPVPVFLPKSAESLVADIGAIYSANAYANLDVKSPPQRLSGILQNLKANVIVTSEMYASTLISLGIPQEQLLLIEQAMVSEVLYLHWKKLTPYQYAVRKSFRRILETLNPLLHCCVSMVLDHEYQAVEAGDRSWIEQPETVPGLAVLFVPGCS